MSLRRPTAACTVFTFCYKPFMWCRPEARLWHFPLEESFRHSFGTRINIPHFPLEESFRHSFGTSITILHFPLEESFRHSFGTSITILQFPLEASFRPSLDTQYLLSLCLNALVDLFICFMFTFVISYVQTVLRVLS